MYKLIFIHNKHLLGKPLRLIKKLIQFIMIAAFLMGISLPSIAMIMTSDQKISDQENRELAQMPQLQWNRPFTQMVSEIQAYLNDQFGYRETLIYTYGYWKAIYLKKSPSERVIIGQDGWLFLAEPDQIRDYQGLYTYNKEQEGYWRYIFQRRQDWLAERDIIYVLVLAPDKKTIYPEYFPTQYPVIYPKHTRLDQFLETIQHQTNIHVVDLRVPLLDYKTNSGDPTLLYHKTDTHWNLLGGYLAYAYLIQELQTYYPDLPLLAQTELTYEFVHENAGQGLTKMMGFEDAYTEDYPHYTVPEATQCAEAIPYIGVLYTQVGVQTYCAENDVNIVFFHDSFFRRIRPFISESFANTLYFYHIRFEPWLWEQEMTTIIETYHPTIVVEEMVERTIPKPPGWRAVIVPSRAN